MAETETETAEKLARKGWKKAAPIFRCDRRTLLGRRIDVLARVYADALGGVLTPLQAEQVGKAAQLTALAERARSEYAAGRETLDQVIRAERVASLAVKRLGIRHEAAPKPVDLDSYLAGKRAGQCG